jgi:hypothetical protein
MICFDPKHQKPDELETRSHLPQDTTHRHTLFIKKKHGERCIVHPVWK